jgi:small-conductance mechanosensitive channel
MPDINSLADLVGALTRPAALVELIVLVACLGLAWLIAHQARRSIGSELWLGRSATGGALFPILALVFVLVARQLLAGHLAIAVFRLAVPILSSLAIIRSLVQVLHLIAPQSKLVRAIERTVSWLIWFGLVLWITGVLPRLLDELDDIHWKVGGANVSLRSLLEGALSAAVVLMLALWLSAMVEARLMRATTVNMSMRKMAANATRATLLVVGVLMALSAAGIPLGALSVLGGAFGVGLGFGMQKLAANYVSGFVILAERSLRIGDVVKVDNFEGRVSDITTRYTVLRSPNGRESIVPNEMLISQRVENCSLADPNVALTTVVQVAYGTDLARLMPRLVDAVRQVGRVLGAPAPSIQLSNFAADGLELTCVFWISDPGDGLGNVRSDVNLAILRTFDAERVEIPFPQRVLRHVDAVAAVPAARPADPG